MSKKLPRAKAEEQTGDDLANTGLGKPIQAPESASVPQASLFSRLNYTKILQILILLALPSVYAFYASEHFWSLPYPSDPLQYLEPAAVIHSLVGWFPWIDRIVLAIGLRLSAAIFSPIYVAGMYYIAVVNFLIITIGVFCCYIKKGFLAGLFAGILLVSSYTFLRYATYIYPDQTMALFALLAFVFFFSKYKSKLFDPVILAGLFTALTCFSKLTGVAILIPFIILIVSERKWGEIKKLVIGFLAGTLVVFFITYLLFGWDSIAYLPFGAANYYGTGAGAVRYGIDLSYFNMLVKQYYLPIFFSMIVFVGAYRQKLTRHLYLAAMSFVVLYGLYIVFTNNIQAINNYLYPAVVFGSLGLAMYLATILKEGSTRLSTRFNFIFGNKAQLIYAVICLICVFVAIKIGVIRHAAFINPAAEGVPGILRMAYPVIPLIIIGGLLLIEYSKSRIIILLFMILISLWSPAHNGAYAYERASSYREFADFFYTAAPVLNDVPAKEFSVYVEDWNKRPHAKRIDWVYRAFFNEKYTKISQRTVLEEMRNSFLFIGDKKDIPMAKGNQILTDNPEKISQYWPTKQIKTILWEGTTLTVLEISRPESYSYESNFSAWNGPDTVRMEELAKTAPPLTLSGYRGDFSFTRLPTENGNVLRVNLLEPHPTEPSEIQFGYSFPAEELDSKTENNYISFALSVRLSDNAKNPAELFAQDKAQNWERNSVFTSQTSWKEYTISKRIRDGASRICLGIVFKPESEDEWLEIRQARVAGWSPE